MENLGLTFRENIRVMQKREVIVKALESPADSTVAILGPCAMTFNTELNVMENFLIQQLESEHRDSGLIALHRLPFWKPRTNVEDWHGAESTHPEEATKFIQELCKIGFNIAAETGLARHIGILSEPQEFSWYGGRNFGNIKLIEQLMRREIDIPIGVKNGLDGNVQDLLEFTKLVNDRNIRRAPPVVPIFRGGFKLDTPQKWGEAVKQISAMTRGRCIIDLAHGSEMAHDPRRKFGKSEQGQFDAVLHLIELIKAGNVVAGFMIETSNIQSPTDPVLRLAVGLKCAHMLLQAKNR